MVCQLNNLDCRLVAGLDRDVLGKRDLGKADGTGVGVVGWADNLESGNHVAGHVGWATIWTIFTETHIDVGESSLMASEPAWLEGNRASGRRPVCAVLGDGSSTTYKCVSRLLQYYSG